MSEDNPCLTFFDEHEKDGKKVQALQQQPDSLQWENLTASRHSPGTVGSQEYVLRLAFQPLHIDPDSRTLKPSAVSDVKDKGFSVDRLNHVSRDASIETGRTRAAKALLEGRTPRNLCAVVPLEVSAIRAIHVDGKQAFGIYDTAQADNRAHADVCQLVPEGHASRSARSRLLELCDSVLEILT